MAFSGAGKDMSVRLRAQNMKNAKDQTLKLEQESRKMEDRLRELKMAMSKEKEQRETNGGVFWKSGKTGSLGNDYTKEVMTKPQKPAAKKKVKVKVLKDEPIVAPARNKGPGTMGFIAQRNITDKENKIKGPKCGQCEQKAAQVTCLDCGEDYCAGCFASFHLKGALKKHRSVPARAGDTRMFSPRVDSNSSKSSNTTSAISSKGSTNGYSNGYKLEDNPMKVTLTEIDFTLNTQDIEGNRESPVGASQAFDGPSLLEGNYNEADSAAAFQAALKDWRNGSSRTVQQKSPSPHKVSSVESGTSTASGLVKKPIEIQFKKGGLTYAEKLLLKKHRRTSLDPLETPRLGSVCETKSDSSVSVFELTPRTAREDKENREGLHEDPRRSSTRPNSQISIMELTDGPKISSKGIEQTKTYYVKEDPGTEEQLQTAREEKKKPSGPVGKRQAFVTPPSSAKQKSARHRKVKSPILPADIIKSDSPLPDLSKPVTARLIEVTPAKNTTRDDQARPKSRSQKVQGVRPGSRNTKRPSSRAASRLALFGEGTLTKSPSEALRSVATRSVELPPIDITSTALMDFFTGGVKLEQEEKITPRTPRDKHKDDKYKLSNKVYQMAPRSWRPDSSFGGSIPADQIVIESTHVQTGCNQTSTPPLNDISSYELNQKKKSNDMHGYDTDDDVELPVLTSRNGELGRLSRLGRESRTGRESRAIVIDGDDLSRYDDAIDRTVTNDDDLKALDQLDWELASEAGMVTEDGKISRLSVIDLPETEDKQDDIDIQTLRELMTPRDKGIDIHHHLRESELMEDFEEMEAKIMEDEVKALR